MSEHYEKMSENNGKWSFSDFKHIFLNHLRPIKLILGLKIASDQQNVLKFEKRSKKRADITREKFSKN